VQIARAEHAALKAEHDATIDRRDVPLLPDYA
jgi:hypothetical protein